MAAAAVVFVAGVGLGDREAEVAFYPGQDGVTDPVHADLLGRHPGEFLVTGIGSIRDVGISSHLEM